MDPCMYIVLNKGIGMSTGKAAAQASHAAVEAYRLSLVTPPDIPETKNYKYESNLARLWYKGGHYKKIVLEARDRCHLRDTERYLNDRGFKTALIIDEGHTEVPAITPTALGVEIVDKDDPHTAATFGEFNLYNDPEPQLVVFDGKLSRSQFEEAKRIFHDEGRDAASDYLKSKQPQRRKSIWGWLRDSNKALYGG